MISAHKGFLRFLKVASRQAGRQIDEQRQHHQDGGDGEGHVELTLLLGVDVQCHRQRGAGGLQRFAQEVVQLQAKARR